MRRTPHDPGPTCLQTLQSPAGTRTRSHPPRVAGRRQPRPAGVTPASPSLCEGLTAAQLLDRVGREDRGLRDTDLQAWLTGEGLATIDDRGGLHVTDDGRDLVDVLTFTD